MRGKEGKLREKEGRRKEGRKERKEGGREAEREERKTSIKEESITLGISEKSPTNILIYQEEKLGWEEVKIFSNPGVIAVKPDNYPVGQGHTDPEEKQVIFGGTRKT
jgi:hypothetical protein